MPETFVIADDFNDYVDNISLHVLWTGGTLGVGSGLTQDASPDASQYVKLGLDAEGAVDMPWGTQQSLASRTFTGLTPDGNFRVRFKMNIGHSASSVIGGFPSVHSFTAGLQANDDELLVAVVDQHAPEGERQDAEIPEGATIYEYPGVNVSGAQIHTIFGGLAGWLDYDLVTTADGSGEIEITIGTFDTRFFQANVAFEDIQIWEITEDDPEDPPVDPPPVVVFPPRLITSRGGHVFLDSFLEYDGRDAAATDGLFPLSSMRLTGGTLWEPGESLTLTAGASIFTTDYIGHQLFLHPNGDPDTTVKFTVTAYVSATVATGVTDIAVPISMQDTPLTLWDLAVSLVGGVEHLEAKDVGIVADGLVIANPLHPGLTVRTVTDGIVDLGGWYARVFIGLPYVSDLETLDIDTPSGPSLKPSKMNVSAVGVILDDSPLRGLYAANAPPPDTAAGLTNMQEMRQPSDAAYNDAVTEYDDVNIRASWNKHGRVFLRSIDPVLLTILAVLPEGHLPPSS